VIEGEREAELARGGVERAHPLGHHLFADAVAGDHGDAICLFHDGSLGLNLSGGRVSPGALAGSIAAPAHRRK